MNRTAREVVMEVAAALVRLDLPDVDDTPDRTCDALRTLALRLRYARDLISDDDRTAEIADLRAKLAETEAARDEYRRQVREMAKERRGAW